MTDLSALAEKVEGLTGPDEAVDAEVCRALGVLSNVTYWPGAMGGPPYWAGRDERGNWEPVQPYTASLDAVEALIKQSIPSANGYGVEACWIGPSVAWISRQDAKAVEWVSSATGATPALALLAAALRAIATLAADTGEK